MSCQPSYDYEPPNFQPATDAEAPTFNKSRSHLSVGGAFFRSINQGRRWNNLSLQLLYDNNNGEYTLILRYYNPDHSSLIDQESFTIDEGTYDQQNEACSPDEVAALESAVNNSSQYIEAPGSSGDVHHPGYDDQSYESPTCLPDGDITETFMSGAEGPPYDPDTIYSYQTGPDRTIIIIKLYEDDTGELVDPPPSDKILQWDGTIWLPYCNYTQGDCPTTTC